MSEEEEDGCPVLGFFARPLVLYLNTTPFFASRRSYLVDLNFMTHRTEYNSEYHPAYKQPGREPVKPLNEFGMSADGPHMYHIEKCGRRTVEQVQSEPELGTPRLEQNQSPIHSGKRINTLCFFYFVFFTVCPVVFTRLYKI